MRSALNRPIAWISLAILAIAVVVSPWGDYPVNDDWQYARVAKLFAETGAIKVDVAIGAASVVQVWLSAPFVLLFGFSHTLLRSLTIVIAIVLVWTVDRILQRAGAARGVRVLAAVLLVANPLFLHVAFSYMTEVYAYALALGGALVWLNGRADGSSVRPLVTRRTALVAATLIGASFWNRQFGAAVFPALVLATIVRQARDGNWQAVRRSLPAIAVGSVWFFVIVLSYFVWARATGNYTSMFDSQLRSVVRVNPSLGLLSMFELAAYLTLFLFPFLLLERWRKTRWTVFAVAAVATTLLIGHERSVQSHDDSLQHHARFPFTWNVVNDASVGPITLTPTYWTPTSPRPRWPRAVWTAIEWLLVGGMLLWGRVIAPGLDEPRIPPLAEEIRDFGVLFAAISFVLYVQTFQWQVVDRYMLPCLFGILIALGARVRHVPAWPRQALAIAAALPLAWFTIAGVHDYFRWNDARWEAVRLAEADGAQPEVLDGGFEVNGWLNYDAVLRHAQPNGCLGPCGCAHGAFHCTDGSYLISMEVPVGRTQLAALPVSWWLARGPDVILSRR